MQIQQNGNTDNNDISHCTPCVRQLTKQHKSKECSKHDLGILVYSDLLPRADGKSCRGCQLCQTVKNTGEDCKQKLLSRHRRIIQDTERQRNDRCHCRKEEYETYNTNKKVVSKSDKEQNFYENVFNYIEADNNDGVNPYNRATFSKQLVKKLLSMYYVGGVVYDSFMGIGTTAKVCFLKGIDYVGSEIDEEQVRYFKKWKKKQSNTTF